MNKDSISYEEVKNLAIHQDPEVRAAVARREDVPPEILYFLAEDSAPEVRRTVALNSIAPGPSAILLAQDSHAGVRSDLATKIAKMSGSASGQTGITQRATGTALRILAKDQVPDVREVLAESIKDVEGAPEDVIKVLAKDSKLEVCGPVLENSPVLGENDLIEIIAASPVEGALSFISRRKHVEERVCEAIVTADDENAIADLLSNHGAHILEQTLDRLVERAEGVELWHAPIVARPKLSSASVERMSEFISSDLLRDLENRTDLNDEEASSGEGSAGSELETSSPGLQSFLKSKLPLIRVSALFEKGKLTFDIILRALESQDYGFVLAALIVRSEVEPNVAQKIFSEKSAKGIIALCCIAKFDAEMMIKIQQRMGRIAPSEVIAPKNGELPMSDEDANWQVEFYTKLAHKGGQ